MDMAQNLGIFIDKKLLIGNQLWLQIIVNIYIFYFILNVAALWRSRRLPIGLTPSARSDLESNQHSLKG